jgi:NAD/NADP transhydrogenase beta subunit
MMDVILGLSILFGGLLVVVGIAALLLYWRDTRAKSAGKTAAQIEATSQAVVQLYVTLKLAVPGVLMVFLGSFMAFDRLQEHDPEALLFGLVLVILGGATIRLLARKSWGQYLELKRFSNAAHDDRWTKAQNDLE